MNGFCSVSRVVAGSSGKRWGVIAALPRGWAGRQSLVGTGKSKYAEREFREPVGAERVWDGDGAEVEYALPEGQRRGKSGFGPSGIMSCPGGAERSRGRVERMAVG